MLNLPTTAPAPFCPSEVAGLAEVLDCALAFKLLLGASLPAGVILTAFDTLLVLGLKGKAFARSRPSSWGW